MTRLNLVLLLVLMASALALVRSSYEARRLFAAVERAKGEERLLEVEFKRLDAERQAQSMHLRVENMARQKLQMRSPDPGVTQYVVDLPSSGARR